jgi:hypothetical protein
VIDHKTRRVKSQYRRTRQRDGLVGLDKLADHSTAARSPEAIGSANRHSTASSTANWRSTYASAPPGSGLPKGLDR